MKKIIHRADQRGHADHGWLKANHSFSFASWYNPGKMNFGVLRVFNDDQVAAGTGFGKHPHDNMEIITLVQEGALQHADSMGNTSIMRPDEVQVMSAGTGIYHSEMNPSSDEALKLFQIWVHPDKEAMTPRYDQKTFLPEGRKNKWQEIIKPDSQSEGDAIFIHQQAWFYLADPEKEFTMNYSSRKKDNGAYVFVIEGSIEVDGEKLGRRDAIGISEYENFTMKALEDSRILVMDIPMIDE